MEVKVSLNNEFYFTPDIWGNMDQKEDERFKIVLRKMNAVIHSGKWSKLEKDGSINTNMFKRAAEHIVRLVNPPNLLIGKKKKTLDIETIGSDEYAEVGDLVEEILIEINRLNAGDVEEKK